MSIRPKRALINTEIYRPSSLNSVPRDPSFLWLDKNENLDPELLALIATIYSKVDPKSLSIYPEAGVFYRKLAKHVGVSPDALILTPGSDGAIRMAFDVFVEYGDHVLHTSPTFAMYPVYGQIFGAKVTSVEYVHSLQGPQLEVDKFIAQIYEIQPKLVCLPNPDSPTGTVVTNESLMRLLKACEEVGALLLIDEAYYPFYNSTVVSWTAESRNIIVARTFSKAWGAAGVRLGYLVAHPETIKLFNQIRPMYECGEFLVRIVSELLDFEDDMLSSVERIKAGGSYFANQMESLDFKVMKTYGNFIHVNFGERAKIIHAALNKKVLYRAVFEHPSLSGFSRFSIAPESIMKILVSEIQEALRRK
jgi:histidinol-phosphate aminotransferase